MNHEDKNIFVDLYEDGIGKVQLVESYGSDLTVVNAARVSFGVKKEELSDKDKKLVNYLIQHRHTSVFEHCGITFKFIVPLFVRSQHHRHRTWSYNEISRRYTDVDLRFYEPESFRTQHKQNRQASNPEDLINPEVEVGVGMGDIPGRYFGKSSNVLKRWHKDSLKVYDSLLDAGVCREQARGILPQSLYTEYYGTCNLNNLIKFISLRTHQGAQWEIQQVAKACMKIASGLFPVSMSAFESR